MIVIADTSPINYLVSISAIDILPHLFGSVILPQSVYQELIRADAPEAVRQWIAQAPHWIMVRAAAAPQSYAGLGAGETEAISLALELHADLVLMDERKGRRVAAEQGLSVGGTLLILEAAAKNHLLDLPQAIEKLKQTNFRITEQALNDLLLRDRQRRGETP